MKNDLKKDRTSPYRPHLGQQSFSLPMSFSNKRILSSIGWILRTRPPCLAISLRQSATFDERKRFDRKP